MYVCMYYVRTHGSVQGYVFIGMYLYLCMYVYVCMYTAPTERSTHFTPSMRECLDFSLRRSNRVTHNPTAAETTK